MAALSDAGRAPRQTPGGQSTIDALTWGMRGREVLEWPCTAEGGGVPPPPPAYRALIRPSGEDAMGRSCILDSPPGRWMPVAVRMPAVVRMPACHSRRFKGERPIGATGG